jgi:hypothetical protein
MLYGYGVNVRVERGHLVAEGGVGSDRYKSRFPASGTDLSGLS